MTNKRLDMNSLVSIEAIKAGDTIAILWDTLILQGKNIFHPLEFSGSSIYNPYILATDGPTPIRIEPIVNTLAKLIRKVVYFSYGRVLKINHQKFGLDRVPISIISFTNGRSVVLRTDGEVILCHET